MLPRLSSQASLRIFGTLDRWRFRYGLTAHFATGFSGNALSEDSSDLRAVAERSASADTRDYVAVPTSSSVPAKSNKSSTSQKTKCRQSSPLNNDWLESQLRLSSPADILRRIFLGHQSLNRAERIHHRLQQTQQAARARRVDTRENEIYPRRIRILKSCEDDSAEERAAANLEVAADLLRFQIKACTVPEDLLSIVTAASNTTNPSKLQILSITSIQIVMTRKLEGMNDIFDTWHAKRGLAALSNMQRIFVNAGLSLHPALLVLAAKTAASDGNYAALAHWLTHLSGLGTGTLSTVAVSDILSAMQTGLQRLSTCGDQDVRRIRQIKGALRCLHNLKPVLGRPCYIAAFLADNDTIATAAYIEILGKCSQTSLLVSKWKQYRQSPRYAQTAEHLARPFMLALMEAGEPAMAWEVFGDAFDLMPNKDAELWEKLLLHAESMPAGLLRDRPVLRQEVECGLAEALVPFIERVENWLGIFWSGDGLGNWFHRVSRHDTNDSLQKLGADDFVCDISISRAEASRDRRCNIKAR